MINWIGVAKVVGFAIAGMALMHLGAYTLEVPETLPFWKHMAGYTLMAFGAIVLWKV